MPYEEELFALAMDFANSPELPSLKKRFSGWSICKDHATAAAFGYLAAKREAEGNEETSTDIYDQLCTTMDQLSEGKFSSEEATELAMGLVYHWLKEGFIEDGFSSSVLEFLDAKFELYVKPSAIM